MSDDTGEEDQARLEWALCAGVAVLADAVTEAFTRQALERSASAVPEVRAAALDAAIAALGGLRSDEREIVENALDAAFHAMYGQHCTTLATFHEAGHAVADVLAGMTFVDVFVYTHPSSPIGLNWGLDVPESERERCGGRVDQIVPRFRPPYTNALDARVEAITHLAGPAAEARAMGRTMADVWNSGHAAGDVEKAMEVLERCPSLAGSRDVVLASVIGLAHQLVADPDTWRAITRIAVELLFRGRIPEAVVKGHVSELAPNAQKVDDRIRDAEPMLQALLRQG